MSGGSSSAGAWCSRLEPVAPPATFQRADDPRLDAVVEFWRGDPTALKPGVPEPSFALRAIFPNPSHGEASVRFSLADDAPATLDVFDVLGRRLPKLAGQFAALYRRWIVAAVLAVLLALTVVDRMSICHGDLPSAFLVLGRLG